MPLPDCTYRLTAAGRAALSQPAGRLSRGFLRLLGVLNNTKTLEQAHQILSHLSEDELVTWCDELISQGLAEPSVSAAQWQSAAGVGENTVELFDQTIEVVAAMIDRAAATAPPPLPAKTWVAVKGTDHVPTVRMTALEALNTTRRMSLHGFFAYASRRADGKTKLSEFRILIVQDDHVQSQLANAIVSKEGYRVALAHSLVAFRGALRAQLRPDLVLLDVDLPDGNGFDELETLRMQTAHAKLCVMMLTGRSDEASIARGVMLGANGYVTKPYSGDTLLGAVRKALDLA